ncbi:4-hydroxy-tetrahydrodipicolinate reductase [Coralloluteibacterium thermophilus]|uniref:4-hydroxy-tetrahydrodipicolinate reductase n=1 Tax=Coralloluteibacterium thermophilum TaxID=2707049 RepID=A0ABV9NLE0_9GAMM
MRDDSPIRLLIHGASGRMGQSIVRLLHGDGRFALVALVARSPVQAPDGVEVLAPDRLDAAPEFDLAIDFSLPEAFDAILHVCHERRSALVSGTTGLAPAQCAALDAAALDIPALWAANFSLGVAVMAALARRAAAAVPGWDCDIVEAHHVHKKDAPSGTALALGAAVEQGRGREPAYASLRAGDIVGEHTVQFATAGERIELVHRATNRDIFARGAIEAAARLAQQPPGQYRFADLMFPGLD